MNTAVTVFFLILRVFPCTFWRCRFLACADGARRSLRQTPAVCGPDRGQK